MDSIDIIMPTYNDRAKKILLSLKSIFKQDYTNFKIFLIDDGSDVPYGGIEDEELKKIDDRLFVITNKSNQGVAYSRNHAAKIGNSKFIAFMDTGDLWSETFLSKMISIIKANQSTALVCSATAFFTSKNKIQKTSVFWPYNRDLFQEALIRNFTPGAPTSWLIRREIFEKYNGFYALNDIPEDQYFLINICKNHNVDFLNDINCYKEIDINSRSANPEKKLKTYLVNIALNIHNVTSEQVLKSVMTHYYLTISQKFFTKKSFFLAFKFFIKSFSCDLRTFTYLVKVSLENKKFLFINKRKLNRNLNSIMHDKMI